MSERRVQSGESGSPLTHEQAEALVSARLDAHLEPVENRELLLHLQGCASCRAFAVQLEIMVREFNAVYELMQEKKIDMRTAAYTIALNRIGAAVAAQGTMQFFTGEDR